MMMVGLFDPADAVVAVSYENGHYYHQGLGGTAQLPLVRVFRWLSD
ncbi:MAG: hypothetical protein ACRDFX_14230 [Chloroflexota bacterium]